MGFCFLRFGFGFSGVVIVVPVHVRKRKPRLKPAIERAVFLSCFLMALQKSLDPVRTRLGVAIDRKQPHCCGGYPVDAAHHS
jgi:hypothetical protein